MATDEQKYLNYSRLKQYNQNLFEKLESKQDKLSGTVGQLVGFDENGNAITIDENKEMFIINCIINDETQEIKNVDKTFEEITEAYHSGKNVILQAVNENTPISGEVHFVLSSFYEAFAATFSELVINNAEMTASYIMISSDNTAVFQTVQIVYIDFANKSDLEGLATETYVTNAIAQAQLSGGDVDLSGYYTKDETYSNTEVDELVSSVSDEVDELRHYIDVELLGGAS